MVIQVETYFVTSATLNGIWCIVTIEIVTVSSHRIHNNNNNNNNRSYQSYWIVPDFDCIRFIYRIRKVVSYYIVNINNLVYR